VLVRASEVRSTAACGDQMKWSRRLPTFPKVFTTNQKRTADATRANEVGRSNTLDGYWSCFRAVLAGG
jgi:hypothetical protein